MDFKKFKDNYNYSFLKDNFVMFVVVSLSSLFAFIYQVYVIRKLSPSEYGIFNSLISFLVIFSIPLTSLQTVVADFTSRYRVNHNFLKIKYLLFNLTKKTFLFSIFFLIFVFLFMPYINSFLKIQSLTLLAILAFTLVFYFFLPLIQGTLQGLEKFGHLGNNVIIHSLSRLILGVILINIGLKIGGALSAFAISTLIALLVPLFFLKRYLNQNQTVKEDYNSGDLYIGNLIKYFLPTAVALFCFALLTNMDVILVKHFFSSKEAGFYSISQMIGKIVLLFPSAITVVMFPKVSSQQEKKEPTLSILNKSLILTLGLSLFIMLIIFIFPELILKLISGKIYYECLPLIYWFTLAMVLYSLVNVFLYYHLSLRNFYFVPILIIFTLLEFGLIWIFHRSLTGVVQILTLLSFFILITNIFFIKCQKNL